MTPDLALHDFDRLIAQLREINTIEANLVRLLDEVGLETDDQIDGTKAEEAV